MTITYIYTALTTFGGVDRVLTEKANYFAEAMNYDVYFITDSQAGRPPVFPLSNKVHFIDLETDFDEQYHYNIVRRFFCYRRLMKQYKERLSSTLEQIKPDFILLTCGRELDFLTRLNLPCKIIGESHISKEHCRNFHLMEAKGGVYKMMAKYWRMKQEKAIRMLDAFVVLTKADAFSWQCIREAHVIPNPIIINPDYHSNCESKNIIAIGRLNEQKGFERLIEAWSLIHADNQDWRLTIFGEGEQQKELEELIVEKGVTSTCFIKPPTQHIAHEYHNSSMLVMSSRFEGLPMVLLEAMSYGLPCISFNCPHGPADIIKNDINGLLVENGNIKQLASAIEKLTKDALLRKKMGEQAFCTSENYRIDNIIQKWIDLFNEL